jgi:DNA repair exonuclease SbcCD ATPase subunit
MKELKQLVDKLDGLQRKKADLVKQRDQGKEEVIEVRKQTGYDLLNGTDIDKAGAELMKRQARIETLTSAINAAAAAIAEVEENINTLKQEQAKKEAEQLKKEADALAVEIAEQLADLIPKGKRLQDLAGKARGLGVPTGGGALAGLFGKVITDDAINTLEKIAPIGGKVEAIKKAARREHTK